MLKIIIHLVYSYCAVCAAPTAGSSSSSFKAAQQKQAALWTKAPSLDQTSLTIETSDLFNLNPGNSYKFNNVNSNPPTSTSKSPVVQSRDHLLSVADTIHSSTTRAVMAIGDPLDVHLGAALPTQASMSSQDVLMKNVFSSAKGTYQYDGSNIMSKRTCYNYCLDTYNSSHIIDPDRLSNGIYAEKIYDQHVISDFCKLYRNQQNCLHGCGVSFQALSEAFSVHDFLCIQHYEEFLRSINCYRKANVSVAADCYPRCGSTGVLQNLAIDVQRAQMRSDMSSLIRLTSEICSYTRCIIDCQTPIIYTICGDLKPANLLRLFMNASMERSVSQLRQVGKAHLLPVSCRDFHPWTTTTVQAYLAKNPIEWTIAATAEPSQTAKPENLETLPDNLGQTGTDDISAASKTPQLSWQLILVCILLSVIVCFNFALMVVKLPCR